MELSFSSLEPWQSVVTALICMTVFYVTNFYLNVRKYPRGPFPLPALGNITYLFPWTYVNKGRNPLYKFHKLQEKYGPIYTIWFGSKPAIFLNDPALVKEAFQNNGNNVSDRPLETLARFYTQERGTSVAFSNFSPQWSSLRKVALMAVRKYSNTEGFANLCSETVESAVKSLRKKEVTHLPFDFSKYIWLTLINIVSNAVFGDRFGVEDEEFLYLYKLFIEVQYSIDVFGYIDGLPDILKPIFYQVGKRSFTSIGEMRDLCRRKYLEHLKNYNHGQIRDFSDALIAAKEEAIQEQKEVAGDLTDDSLSIVTLDLFGAGIDTTANTLRWVFLMLALKTDLQIKMRRQIREVVGDRMPVQQDKDECHLVMAFIAECLRFQPMGSLAAPHKVIGKVTIGGYELPENTIVISNIFSIHNNAKFWPNPEIFDPNRFLDSEGHFLTVKPLQFMPFSVGRRQCPGQRLAWLDMFLVITRFLQLTDGQLFVLPEKPSNGDLEIDPKSFYLNKPKPYKVVLTDCSY